MIAAACNFNQLIRDFIDVSKDGYAIFCPDDKLLFANYVFLDAFCATQEFTEYWTFDQLVTHAYKIKRGVNIETERLEDWLSYVHSVRRKRAFRIFEVDLVDGRWMLFSEQLLESGELLVQIKDISKQKLTEITLKDSVTKLKKLALTDSLTNLANRRAFVDAVETELARCQRNDLSATMLVIDLDYFKKINDTYGHLAGDEVLVHTAQILRRATRQYDIIGRLGGEEFAVFMTDTDASSSFEIAERIRQTIQATPTTVDDIPVAVTTSIGISIQTSPSTFENLFNDADEALYHAKSLGRNQTVASNKI